jgi:tRNA A64-2'-O-ribosylphosphate transferase
MPDSLSKTIPIWCAVFNRVLFPSNPSSHSLHVPSDLVSESEKSQIEARIDGFVRQLHALDIDLSAYASRIQRPLRPIWVTRATKLPRKPSSYDEFCPIILCTASKRVHGTEMSEGGYIQGAGDDAEEWSRGLTPLIFWKHKDLLMETRASDLPDLIHSLLQNEARSSTSNGFQRLTSCPEVFIGCTQDLNVGNLTFSDKVIWCDVQSPHWAAAAVIKQQPDAASAETRPIPSPHILHLPLRANKLGSRDLRIHLWSLIPFLQTLPPDFRHIYICCPDGKDLSIGVALAVLCLFQTPSGTISTKLASSKFTGTKQAVRQELAKLMLSIPDATPSRTTLQSVNDFLFNAIEGIDARQRKQGKTIR